MDTIALFGATGTIGSRVLHEALRRGHRVTAVVRDRKPEIHHPALSVVVGDVLDADALPGLIAGHDVVVSAVGGGDGPGHVATVEPAARALVAALRGLGAPPPRLIVVNGAGSLRAPSGRRVWDTPGLPGWLLQVMRSHGDALAYLRTVEDVPWTAVSPAATIEPGVRTGAYRTDLDRLVTDADGVSWISTEDFAVALVDEIAARAHVGRRFTVAR